MRPLPSSDPDHPRCGLSSLRINKLARKQDGRRLRVEETTGADKTRSNPQVKLIFYDGMMYYHTGGRCYAYSRKLPVTLEEETLERLDTLVEKRVCCEPGQGDPAGRQRETGPDRTGAIGGGVEKLDPAFEKAMAEEGILRSWINGPNTEG